MSDTSQNTRPNSWTDRFEGNFSWSNATMVTKGMAPYGVVALGENDRIVPASEARTLYQHIGSAKKTLKIFDAEEGGAEHCQVDDRQAGVNWIADWLSDTVFGATG